jgi:hypothetical protein
MTKLHDKLKSEIKMLRQKYIEVETMNQLFKQKIKELTHKNKKLEEMIDEYLNEEIILLKPTIN